MSANNVKVCWSFPPKLAQTTYNGLSVDQALQLQGALEALGAAVSVYGLPVKHAEPVRVRQGKKGEEPACSLCGTVAPNDAAHPLLDCLSLQVSQCKSDNSALKNSEKFWKNAWYQNRDIIGKLAWKNIKK